MGLLFYFSLTNLEIYNKMALKKYDVLLRGEKMLEKQYKELEKEYQKLQEVCRDIDRDFINQMQINNELIEENKRLKEEIQKLKNENIDLGIEKIKVSYEEKIKKLEVELEEAKSKITLQTRTREISDKQVEEIKELRALGLSYRAIEEKTKWSRFTIGRVLKGEYDN